MFRPSIKYGMAATGICVVVYATLKNVDFRGIVSTLCEQISSEPVNVADLSRDAFANYEVPDPVLTSGHTHPEAAASRNQGIKCANSMAVAMGTDVFILQMSRSDQRKGQRGSRQWYWAKDTNVQNRRDQIHRDDIIYICDTDYYVDMPNLLSDQVKPVVLYTAVPSAAASTHEDSSVFFDEHGNLHTLVSGGGGYSHPLWDYGADSLMVSKTFLGYPYKVVTYAVERKQISDHRQIILLAPMKMFSGISAMLAAWLFSGKKLSRFNPIVTVSDGSKFVRFRVHKRDQTMITTARPMNHLCATVSAATDDAIATIARLGTTNLMLPTVASWLGKDERAASAVLTEYHRLASNTKIPTVFPVEKGVRAYQYEPEQYDQDAKPKLEAFMSPLVHGAFAPVPNAAGERRCVEGRINSLKKEEPRPNAFRDQCLREFIDLVCEGMVLEPASYETIAEKQTNPAQKLSLKKATLAGDFVKRVINCFLKSEAYGDIKDPRNISKYNDKDKLSMAQFAHSLAKHLKKFKWYASGMTPLEIAQRVADVCLDADFMNISDFHRMDGTITKFLRRVDGGIYMRVFVNHRAELNELLKRNADNYGVLPLGTSFEQGSSHGSGCSSTSVSQTLRAVFTSYLAYRHTRKSDGSYYTPRESFEKIGIHSGDDGADPDLPVVSHQWAASKVGLVLEAHIVPRGFPGVNFLARYYSSEVWEGRLDSMCDVRRQLSKFHTTVRLPNNVKPEHKLVEKCMAYAATDGNTPVIGPLCKRVLVLSEYRPTVMHGLGNWWSKFDDSCQYPNKNDDGWMDVDFDRQFPEFDHSIFNPWLASTKSAEEILAAPQCAEPKEPTPQAVDVVVDEEIILAKTEQTSPQSLPEVKTECKEKEEKPQIKAPKTKPKVLTVKKGGSVRQYRIVNPTVPKTEIASKS